MARPCATCRHPERAAIERDHLAGIGPAALASTYLLPEAGISRHLRMHLRSEPVASGGGSHDPESLGRLLVLKSLRALRLAESAGDRTASARALKEARESVESLAKLKAEDSRQRFHVERDLVFHALRADLVKILDAFPEARAAVVLAFGGLPPCPTEEEPVPPTTETPEAPTS